MPPHHRKTKGPVKQSQRQQKQEAARTINASSLYDIWDEDPQPASGQTQTLPGSLDLDWNCSGGLFQGKMQRWLSLRRAYVLGNAGQVGAYLPKFTQRLSGPIVVLHGAATHCKLQVGMHINRWATFKVFGAQHLGCNLLRRSLVLQHALHFAFSCLLPFESSCCHLLWQCMLQAAPTGRARVGLVNGAGLQCRLLAPPLIQIQNSIKQPWPQLLRMRLPRAWIASSA